MTRPKVICRKCGHNAHSEALGCSSCLPGLGCGPEADFPDPWDDGRGPGSADALDLAELTVGAREVICAQCHLVHRPGQECP
ncbi:hypothetical protein ADAWI_79 [Mycobacterium phage Adawi]|uniref:Uncharacterized protein n=1 Tax=Mycobacterium phage Adawi TaxID=1354507 RepID=T2A8Z1_9CAUD|nr:hypothetical protein ADAWI_79 [Mycobacterium phage Adawi]AGU91992.1 hypothetical protein ADAWI_79 [Mycobacterium phage Adawi]